MRKKITATILLVCSFMICLAAAITNLTGKWTGTFKTPDGNGFPLTFNLKVDGDKLTGTTESPQGSVDISSGNVKGDSLFFTVSFNGTDIKHAGKYYEAADSVGLDIDFNGQKMHTTLKRGDK